MKKFLIKVNGNQYEVEVEEIKDDGIAVRPSAPVEEIAQVKKEAESKVQAKPEPATVKRSSTVPEGAEPVKAPIPGTVLKVVVGNGSAVKKGDVLLILEAMKMENEIVAPKDGVIASVNVEAGASVNAGDLLVTIG